jgi:hypothetical protein
MLNHVLNFQRMGQIKAPIILMLGVEFECLAAGGWSNIVQFWKAGIKHCVRENWRFSATHLSYPQDTIQILTAFATSCFTGILRF